MKYTRKFFDGWLTYEDEDIKSLRPSSLLEIVKLSLISGITVLVITCAFGICATLLGFIGNLFN